MARTVSVLLVEDDPAVADAVGALLSAYAFAVDAEGTGRGGLARLDDGAYDLLILDIALPDISGLEVLREARRYHQLPVLMLTARSASSDKVHGLDAGADDYLVKPFDPPELLARLKALLRRAGKLTTDPVPVGPCMLDPATRALSFAERSAELTVREVALIEALASVPGKVWTRSQLVSSVWGYDAEVDDRTVDSTVKRLRRKLEGLAAGTAEAAAGVGAEEPVSIRTLYGVGYRLDGVRW